MSSEFSPAAVIVHPSGTNNVGYESAFPLWVTGSTTQFPVVQTITGSVQTIITGTLPVMIFSGTVSPRITKTTAAAADPGIVTRNIPQGTQTVAGSGNFNVVGPGAANAAISGNPVRVGASDGANTRNVLSDIGGRLIVVGPFPTGSLFTGSANSPVMIGGLDPQNRVRAFSTDAVGALQIAVSSSLPVTLSGTQIVTGTVGISGPVSVSVSNFPATQTITGSVSIVGQPVSVQGSVTSVITGTVSTNVTNQVTVTTTGSLPVTISGVQAVTGTVSLSPQPITVQGTVTSAITGTVNTAVTNQVTVTTTGSLPVSFSGVQTVTGTVAIIQPVSVTGTVTSVLTGTVQTAVTNFPATQTVTGTVGIANFPVSQTVNGTVTAVITGTVNTNVLNQVTVTTTGSLPVIFSGIQTITGSVGIGNIVSITGSVLVSSTGSLPVLAKQSQTVVTSSIAASNTVSQTLLSASNNRLFAAVYNDSSARLYLLLGSPASTTSFTVRMDGQSYFEVPIQYTGVVTGIWSSNVGDARMTEVRQ